MTIHKTTTPAPTPATTLTVTSESGSARYWSPITEFGWWLDGDTYVSTVEHADELIEILQGIKQQIQAGNRVDVARPALSPSENKRRYYGEMYRGF